MPHRPSSKKTVRAGTGPGSSSGPSLDPGQCGPGLRLNKALAQAGLCSRRAADELVSAGRVLVNGLPASPGVLVTPGRDEVTVDGRPVKLAGAAPSRTILLNKPVEVVTTSADPQGRVTALSLIKDMAGPDRFFSIGRLDYYSEGLLLLTTDGDLAQALMHPSTHVPKTYEVLVRGPDVEAGLARMRQGMTLAEGERLAPVKARVLSRQGRDRTLVEMILVQGVNRQIRRMCRDTGLTVLRLARVAYGPLTLGSLARGRARELAPSEIEALRKASRSRRT